MPTFEHTISFRVRYSEIDKMGTFYNSHALEWFEWGRVELMRAVGLPYDQLEAQGFFLPLIEAHVEYQGRASFDELLLMTTSMAISGKARVRFDMRIVSGGTGILPVCLTAVPSVVEPNGGQAPLSPMDKMSMPLGEKPLRKVAAGCTIHAITDQAGRPKRPPAWLIEAINKVNS